MTADTRAEIPFVGLRPFDVRDQRWFFGREREAAALASKIRDHCFTAVVGASGSGKSSLVRAGVLPELAREGWQHVVTTPGAAPIARLARNLAAAAASDDDSLGEARRYRYDATLRASAYGLAEIAGQLLPDASHLILVVDQFEELFRYGEEAHGGIAAAMREESRAFVELLLTAADTAERLRIVITMRSDFFGGLATYAGLAEAVSASQFLIPVPRRDQLEAAIRGPVEAAGAVIDDSLVQRLLVDVEEQTDKLPLLQHTLRRLWEQSRRSRRLTERNYNTIGKLAGSIDRKAEKVVKALEADRKHPENLATLERVMKALTGLDERRRATRRPQRRSELVDLIAGDGAEAREAAAALLDRVLGALQAEDTSFLRLEESEVDSVVDIGHEAFIRSWRRLSGQEQDFRSGWVAEEAEDGLNYRWLHQHTAKTGGEPLAGPLLGWWARTSPESKWAERYGGDFDRVRAAVRAALPRWEGGPQTYRWWKVGLDRALAVASIRQRLASRLGTGFLVRAGDLGFEPSDELVVMTAFHVVNEHGQRPGIKPEDVEVVFEAADPEQVYSVDRVLWSSPIERHDASVLRLQTPVTGIKPLPLARSLPVLDVTARVYIIGHPGGRDLAFSFQDNELLDHEGPTAGKPQIPGVCRVHYRAPTEGGSGGSPVFNARLWEVIALHHKGAKMGMPKLNGVQGEYAANEGIGIQSIKEAIAAR
jgi:Trypsin-like peptidase domain/AAA ATPase domain